MQFLDLFLLGQELIIQARFEVHHGLSKHSQLLMILPLHLLLDTLKQSFQLLLLPLYLLFALIP